MLCLLALSVRSNILVSRIFSAYVVGLPLISAANAEAEWAFSGVRSVKIPAPQSEGKQFAGPPPRKLPRSFTKDWPNHFASTAFAHGQPSSIHWPHGGVDDFIGDAGIWAAGAM